MKKEGKKNIFKREYVVPIIIGLFFCFLFLYYGIGVYPDTEGYITMGIGREPLYPTFLWIARSLFGSNGLLIVCILQNILAFFVTYDFYQFIQKIFRLNLVFKSAVLLCLLVPHIMTPLSSPSRIVLTNSILSEGITLSLYLFFFTCLLKAIFSLREKSKNKYAIVSMIVAFLLSITRSQLMITILIWGLVFFMANIIEKKWKRILLIIVFVGCAFGLRSMAISGYNYVTNDRYVGNTGGNMTILTNVLYSSDTNKLHQMKNEELNKLLQGILQTIETEELNYQSAGMGLINKINYQEACHDIIKFQVIDVPIYTYVREQGYTDTTEIKIEMDQVAAELTKELFQSSINSWIMVYLQVASGGFIRTVAFINSLLNWYSLFIYLCAILLICLLFKKNLPQKATNLLQNHLSKSFSRASIIMLLVLIMICANVLATSIMIMCLSRYMIYNMSLFYVAGVLMLWELWQIKREKKSFNY